MERPSWYVNCLAEIDCLREVLGVVQRELLTVKIADGRMGFHDNSRFVAINASHERAVNGGDQAMLKFVRVFAEVPHVAVSVLSKPIKCTLR